MPSGMHFHYTEGYFSLAILFEWLFYPHRVAQSSATAGSFFRTSGSIRSQYSASKLAEEPERFLHFQSAKLVGKLENDLEIIFVTRNKRVTITIDKSDGDIINSEVYDKSQTGI